MIMVLLLGNERPKQKMLPCGILWQDICGSLKAPALLKLFESRTCIRLGLAVVPNDAVHARKVGYYYVYYVVYTSFSVCLSIKNIPLFKTFSKKEKMKAEALAGSRAEA